MKINTLYKRLKLVHIILQFVVLPLTIILAFYYKPKLDFSTVTPSFQLSLWIGILLMPVNWLLEFTKWKMILKTLNLSESQAVKSFASGILSEFLIPGIPSNFIGRIFFFESQDRFKLSAWIQISNLGQFLVTLFFGLFSLLYLNFKLSSNSFYLILGFLLLILIFILLKNLNIIKLPKEIQSLSFKKSDFKPTSFLLLLSLIRFLIFSLQFGLILHSFSIVFDFQLFNYIWISYLFVSFSPSLFLGNLVIRESVTFSVFQLGNYPVFPVLYAAFFIWLVNNFIPVCLAWCYLTFFKKIK